MSDGPLLALRGSAQLRTLCEAIAAADPDLHAGPHRGRGAAPALGARLARLPAISIGCLDARGLSPRSHQAGDVPEAVETRALDRGVEFGLLLVDAIDAHLGRSAADQAVASAQN